MLRAQQRIRLLVEEVRREAEMKEKARFEALKAQIHPHFLFNTLNAIRWKASINQDDEVADILSDLGILLGETYKNDEEFETIDNAVRALDAYVKLSLIHIYTYFFGYGRDYFKAIHDFYQLSGAVPMLPKYVLGNWWSRYWKYTEESYMELLTRFEQLDIPFSVVVMDMDWHLVDIPEKFGKGWTGYTWNREFFPEPKRFLDWLHEHNYRITLNLHPADGVRALSLIHILHNYSKKMPDLNWDNPALKEDMCSMMRWWLDLGVDGFRMDAINRLVKPKGLPDSSNPPTPPVGIYGYVVDRTMCANRPGIHELLHELNEKVFGRYDIMVVGETGNVDAAIAIDYVKEDREEIDMVFHFEIAKNPVLVDAVKFKEVQRRWYHVVEQHGWITQYLSCLLYTSGG